MENYFKKGSYKKTGIQSILDSIGVAAMVAAMTVILLSLEELPTAIPIHTDIAGNFGIYVNNKFAIFIFISIAIIGCITMQTFATYNSFSKGEIDEKTINVRRTYFKLIGAEVAIIGAVLQITVVKALVAGASSINPMISFIGIGLVGITTIIGEKILKKVSK